MITQENKEKIMRAVKDILEAVGEDPNRPGLVETPKRVANMYEEMFAGLDEDPAQHLKLFDESSNDEVVIVRDIPFSSMCEHHLLPFMGKAHIAYIPGNNDIPHLFWEINEILFHTSYQTNAKRIQNTVLPFLHP